MAVKTLYNAAKREFTGAGRAKAVVSSSSSEGDTSSSDEEENDGPGLAAVLEDSSSDDDRGGKASKPGAWNVNRSRSGRSAAPRFRLAIVRVSGLHIRCVFVLHYTNSSVCV